MADPSPIPLTVLGGWLGAGKTTMVNRILATATQRIAVIVNDVGAVNVDAELIRENNADDGVVELTNGCVCCKIGDDLFATLAELSRRDPAPQRVVLEASGVAEPRQVTTFLEHPKFRIDAVIALAEGKGFEYRSSGPPYGSLMRAQLAGADLVVATKLDLVADDEERAASLEELRLFTKAQVIEANEDPEWLNAVMLGAHDNPEHGISSGATPAVATHAWRPEGVVDAVALKSVLRGSGLLRAKGSVAGADGGVLVHLAGDRVEVQPLAEGDEVLGTIVLIGETFSAVGAVVELLDSMQGTLDP